MSHTLLRTGTLGRLDGWHSTQCSLSGCKLSQSKHRCPVTWITGKQGIAVQSTCPLLSWDSVLTGDLIRKSNRRETPRKCCMLLFYPQSVQPCISLCRAWLYYLHLGLKPLVRLMKGQECTQILWLRAFVTSPLPLFSSGFLPPGASALLLLSSLVLYHFLALFKSLGEKVCKKINRQSLQSYKNSLVIWSGSKCFEFHPQWFCNSRSESCCLKNPAQRGGSQCSMEEHSRAWRTAAQCGGPQHSLMVHGDKVPPRTGKWEPASSHSSLRGKHVLIQGTLPNASLSTTLSPPLKSS